MSTMLPSTAPLWVRNHDYSPEEDRGALAALRGSPGIVGVDDFVVSPTVPASWDILISPGRAVLDGTWTPGSQGSYIINSPETYRRSVTPAQGQNRLNLVILHVYDQDHSTEQGWRWNVEVHSGAAGANSLPNLPPNSIPLQVINVASSDTAITPVSLGPPRGQAAWPTGSWPTGDLRRASGTPLYQREFRRNDSIATGGEPGGHIDMITGDLSLPAPLFNAVQGWPFQTVLTTQVWGEFRANGQTSSSMYLNVYRRQQGQTAWGMTAHWAVTVPNHGSGWNVQWVLGPTLNFFDARDGIRFTYGWSVNDPWRYAENSINALMRVEPRLPHNYWG